MPVVRSHGSIRSHIQGMAVLSPWLIRRWLMRSSTPECAQGWAWGDRAVRSGGGIVPEKCSFQSKAVSPQVCGSSVQLCAIALATVEHLTVALGRAGDPPRPAARGDTAWGLCVQSLRCGTSALQPFQKGFGPSLFSSLHVWFSVLVLQLSLVREDSLKFLRRFKKISILSPLNFQNPTKGF